MPPNAQYSRRISDATQELLDVLSEDDAKLLASLHGAPPELAAATLELSDFHLRSTLDAYDYREPHPERPHLRRLSQAGWDRVDELAMLWSEEDLAAHFANPLSEKLAEPPTVGRR